MTRNLIAMLVAVLALTACGDTYLTTIPCDCSGNFYNCDSFATQAEAQNCYDYCIEVVGEDIHRMDGDGNGLVCETAFGGGQQQDDDQQQATSPPPPSEDIAFDEVGTVGDIIDGDTIDVLIGGQEFRVRYIGVNTPERGEPCYDEATQANSGFVSGETAFLVRDVSDTDRFGRLLRYVYVEDLDGSLLFVNAELVRQGYAESVRYEPDTAYLDFFNQLEAEADAAGLGCHPTGIFDD